MKYHRHSDLDWYIYLIQGSGKNLTIPVTIINNYYIVNNIYDDDSINDFKALFQLNILNGRIKL